MSKINCEIEIKNIIYIYYKTIYKRQTMNFGSLFQILGLKK